MKKKIEKSNVGNLFYELQKLKKTDKYFSNLLSGTKDVKSLLRVYGTLSVNIKALAFYDEQYSSSGNNPFWWERTEYELFLERDDIASERFNKCISRNKIVFNEITESFCVSETKEIINILFAQFSRDLVAVWDENDDIWINELFLKEMMPNVHSKGLMKRFDIQIKGEKEILKEFELEKKFKKKEFEDRINSRNFSTSRAGH